MVSSVVGFWSLSHSELWVNTLCRCPQTAERFSISWMCWQTSPPHISTLKISSSFCMKMTLQYLYFFFFFQVCAINSSTRSSSRGLSWSHQDYCECERPQREASVAVFHPGDLTICCSYSTFDARCEAFLCFLSRGPTMLEFSFILLFGCSFFVRGAPKLQLKMEDLSR